MIKKEFQPIILEKSSLKFRPLRSDWVVFKTENIQAKDTLHIPFCESSQDQPHRNDVTQIQKGDCEWRHLSVLSLLTVELNRDRKI